MRNFIALAATAAMLAGCAGTSAQVTSEISNIQSTVAAICAVEPTAASIANLLSANVVVGTVTEIASTICAAVNAPKASAKFKLSGVPAPVVIKGVTITFEPITK